MENRLKNTPPRAFLRYLLVIIPGTAFLTVILALTRHWFGIPAEIR